MDDKIRQVNDRPAERSLNITNVLLSVITILGSIFGTVAIDSMNRMNDSVDAMEISINSLNRTNDVTLNEIKHIRDTVGKHGKRLTKLEEKK